jgi:hypothetical protein
VGALKVPRVTSAPVRRVRSSPSRHRTRGPFMKVARPGKIVLGSSRRWGPTALMRMPAAGNSYRPLSWETMGEPPAEVEAWKTERMRRVRSVGGVIGGFVIGGMAGLASNAILSGTGSFTWNYPLFFAVAVPVGVGEYFFSGWFLPRIARATQLQVRRVAISTEQLHLEQASGKIVEWPLKRVRVSDKPVAGGWYVVSLPAGRTNLSFWVPAMLASSIRAAASK